MNNKNKNIIITGAAGFIGSSLAQKLLKNNYHITGIDNLNDDYGPEQKNKNIAELIKNKNFEFYKADICNINQTEEIFKNNNTNIVIHLAGKAGVRPSIENPQIYVKNNIYGTLNILELMKKYSVPKIIFASSSSVYGNFETEKAIEDITPINPISPYAVTKAAGENLIYSYTQNNNIQGICLRFFTVYGPKQRPDLAIHKFYNLMRNNQPIEMYGDGTTLRNYTYIDDILDGIESAIDYNKTPYEIINLGGSKTIMLSEMIQTLEKLTGIKAQINKLPMQKGDVNKTSADIQKAEKLLNYHPHTDFETGIKNFISWKEKE